MEKELAVPAHWKKIDEKDYKMLGIVNSTHIGCPGAFSIKEENNSYIVVYNDYSKHNLDFIKYLDKQLDELNKLNEDIDGDPSSRDYEDTSTVKNLYHGYINKERGMFYLNVNKVLLAINKEINKDLDLDNIKTIKFNELSENIKNFDLIINTFPSLIIDEKILRNI